MPLRVLTHFHNANIPKWRCGLKFSVFFSVYADHVHWTYGNIPESGVAVDIVTILG